MVVRHALLDAKAGSFASSSGDFTSGHRSWNVKEISYITEQRKTQDTTKGKFFFALHDVL